MRDRYNYRMFGLSSHELKTLRKLNTPIKVQDFLDTFPINWDEGHLSPRLVLRKKKMHCFEGALLAATALWIQGEKPLILDLIAPYDEDHVVALYKRNGFWGAISKTNHASVRFRDPIYKNLRELAISYFHEYFNDKTGKKALRKYSSEPFDLSIFGTEWITSEEDLEYIVEKLDKTPHRSLVPKKNERLIRKADPMERKAGALTEWKRKQKNTTNILEPRLRCFKDDI